VLNLDGVGRFHHLVRGWIVTDLTELSQAPSVIPEADGRGMFVVRLQGTAQVFLEFEPFIEALAQWIDDGLLVKKIEVVGGFDDTAAALAAEAVEIKLSPGQM
jgi:NADPH:quinone reductase-like Zn-dependent oxidoreductase